MERTFTVVFASVQRSATAERALVLQSQGIDSEIVLTEDEYALVVDASDAEAARSEIEHYNDENRNFVPRPKIREPVYLNAVPGLVAYTIVLWVVAIAAEFTAFGFDWYGIGRIDSSAVLSGEWWRLVTALTLHADLRHILGNLGFGLALGYFAGRYFGYGLATLTILASGIAGNAINALVRGPGHYAVGASTAVFGALGLIGIYAWRMRLYPQGRWSQRLGPVIGAIALLAYTGAGGEKTDVGAHLWGFVSGALFGWLFAIFSRKLRTDGHAQVAYAAVAACIVCGAWIGAKFST